MTKSKGVRLFSVDVNSSYALRAESPLRLLDLQVSMRSYSSTWSVGACIALLCTWQACAQTALPEDRSQSRYELKVSVDEVVLTFHALDGHGLPVNDLNANEVRLLDNGSPPRRIVSFDSIVNRPIRAAILLDTSESMQQALPASKRIAQRFAENIFRPGSDQATVIDFAYAANTASRWTGDPLSLSQAIQDVHLGAMSSLRGTAIFSAIYRTCAYDFKNADPSATGNFILLFSDGEDNAGLTSLEAALRACQHSNTVIYAFRVRSGYAKDSTGPKTLADLTANTGGRVFPADETLDAVWDELKTIESAMRNQYRLIYTPTNLKHDGTFHSIELQMPDRVDRFQVRSGYFATR